MCSREENHSRWLHAFADHNTGSYTFSSNLTFSQSEDGYQLIKADFNPKLETKARLKTIAGTQIIGDQILPDLPVGVVSFTIDKLNPNLSGKNLLCDFLQRNRVRCFRHTLYKFCFLGVGVACGSDILVYRNSKPFYKYSVPKLPLAEQEQTAWRCLLDAHTEDVPKFINLLRSVSFEELTPKSQILLTLPKEEWDPFIWEHKNTPLERKTVITAITTLPKKVNGDQSCIVVGTEHGDVLFIDPMGFTLTHQARISRTTATPFKICSCGHFDVQFRLVIGCREGEICVLKYGWLEGNVLFTVTESTVVDMILRPDDLSTIVATVNQKLLCCSKKVGFLCAFCLISGSVWS